MAVKRLPTILFFADVLLLGVAVAVAPPIYALGACAPAGVLAVVACELCARRAKVTKESLEPWRLDSWAVTVGTFGVLALGASVGPEATSVAWLLVALIAGLGFASLPNLATTKRA